LDYNPIEKIVRMSASLRFTESLNGKLLEMVLKKAIILYKRFYKSFYEKCDLCFTLCGRARSHPQNGSIYTLCTPSPWLDYGRNG
jgi:hypothetical protein